jgi:hypothetical protein
MLLRKKDLTGHTPFGRMKEMIYACLLISVYALLSREGGSWLDRLSTYCVVLRGFLFGTNRSEFGSKVISK